MSKELFPVHALLSVYDGHLAGEFSECHRLIEHLCGEPIWTHQLPVVYKTGKMQKALFRQFPHIAALPAPDFEGKDENERKSLLATWNADAIRVLEAEQVEVEGGTVKLGDIDRDVLLDGKQVIGVML